MSRWPSPSMSTNCGVEPVHHHTPGTSATAPPASRHDLSAADVHIGSNPGQSACNCTSPARVTVPVAGILLTVPSQPFFPRGVSMKPAKPADIAALVGTSPIHKAVVKAVGYGKVPC